MSNTTLNSSILNNVVSMVSLYGFIHSPDAILAFEAMSKDDFDVNFAEISKQEADYLARLIGMSDIIMLALQSENAIKNAFPDEIILGIENINQKLKPYEPYVKGIASGSMTNAEAEHQLLSWGIKQHARLRRSKKELI